MNVISKLDNVLYVEVLKENLISINQICDSDLKLQFTNNYSSVTDQRGKCMIKEIRSHGSCYYIDTSPTVICNLNNNDSTT